ncbi:hypothetical protein D3C77_488400 [compost metagenome]
MLSNGCLLASALVIVAAKFGSLPRAFASSTSVSSAPGAAPITPFITAFTHAVLAIWASFADNAAPGALGMPVKLGLSSGAFLASVALIVSRSAIVSARDHFRDSAALLGFAYSPNQTRCPYSKTI